MKRDNDVDDLLVLARRGDLPESEAKRLRDALAASPELEVLFDAGRAFDEEAAVVAGDDERVERIERHVLRRIRPAGARRRAWAARVGLAVALVASAAIGARELAGHDPPAPTPAETSPRLAPTAIATATAVVAPVVETAPTVAPPPPAPSAVDEPRAPTKTASSASAIEATPVAPTASATPPSASELFAAANRARMAGDTALAIRLSREVETQFPSSREAVATHLSLGLLYLQQGSASEALAEFRRSRAVGAPATTADAIWGECRALRQLNRTDEERVALGELLERFPSSPYAAAARRRLAELP